MNLYKIARLIFVILCVELLLCKDISAAPFQLKKVVIDAGHGGNHPGAVWGQYQEKHITLDVALRLGALISSEFPDIEVIYTRTKDVSVGLDERSKIANNAGADLFISIHVNATKGTTARGTETFVMGQDKSQQNFDVAKLENSVITLEDDYEAKYEGFDPSSAESYIIFSLMQYSFMEQSMSFAAELQREYSGRVNTLNRGVKQGPFLVLWKTTMPSVLTEIGFISNAEDRKFIVSEKGKEEVVSSLFAAFKSYKDKTENASSSIAKVPVTKPEPEKVEPKLVKIEKPVEEQKISFMVQVKSSSVKLPLTSKNFGKYKGQVKEVHLQNRYKYLIGGCNSYKDALSLQGELRKYMFSDAFVVGFRDGEQIDIKEVVKDKK